MSATTLLRHVTRLVDWPRSPDTVPARDHPPSTLDIERTCPVCRDVYWCGSELCPWCEEPTGVPV